MHSHGQSGSVVASPKPPRRLPREDLVKERIPTPELKEWVLRCAGNGKLFLSLKGDVA